MATTTPDSTSHDIHSNPLNHKNKIFLNQYLIRPTSTFPPSAYYISDFITPAEELALLQQIDNPSAQSVSKWVHLSHRRLQAHPSALTPTTNTLLAAPLPPWLIDPVVNRLRRLYIQNELNSREKNDKVNKTTSESFFFSEKTIPNHCLINEYQPGQGISPHEDGPAYMPIVCTVSLASHTVLELSRKSSPAHPHCKEGNVDEEGNKRIRILQERCSCLITTDALYTDYLHGITSGIFTDVGLDDATIANWNLLCADTINTIAEADGLTRDRRISLTFRRVVRVKDVSKILNLNPMSKGMRR